MKLLLDECVTRRLQREFTGHEVSTVDEAGFKGLKNGELLRAANARFDVLVTVDQNLPHQQTLQSLTIAILVLAAKKNTYDALVPLMPRALGVLQQLTPGSIVRVDA